MLLVCSVYRKRDLSESLTGTDDEDSGLVWIFYTYGSEVQREKSTSTWVVFKIL